MLDNFGIDSRWEKAPIYLGPGNKELHAASRTVMFDFGALEMLADHQAQAGAFTASSGIETETAPVMIGDTPGSFIRISSLREDDFLIYTPKEPEILIVINGFLTITNQRFFSLFNESSGATGTLASGDVTTLEPEGVQMTAHGLGLQAESLALAIMDIAPDQRGFISIQNGLNRG